MGHNAPLFVHFWSEFDVPLRCESFDGAKAQWSGVAGTMEEAFKKNQKNARCHHQSFSECRRLIVSIYDIVDLQFLTPCRITRDQPKSPRINVPESILGGENLHVCVWARRRKPRRSVGTRSNGAAYGSGLFCTSKYTGKDRKEGSERGREGGGICCRPFDCHCFSWVMWECTRLVFILLCSLLCSSFLGSNIKQRR